MKKTIVLVFTFFISINFSSAHWHQSNLNTSDIFAIGICGNSIFAGTNNGIYLSTDNGINWTLVDSLTNVVTFTTIGNYIFAGTAGYGGGGTGIYLSTNNGSSWNAVNNGLFYNFMGDNLIPNVFTLATKGNTLFAGTMENGIYFSADSGQHWSPVNTGLFHKDINVLAVSGNNIFAGTYNGGVYLSSNNGNSWSAVNSGITNFNIISFAVNGNNIFAGTGSSGGIGQVFRSSDNGNNWITVNNGLPIGSYASFGSLASYGYYVFTTRTFVYATSTNGIIWFDMSDGFPTNSLLQVLSFKVKGDTLFAGTYEEGVWYYPLLELTEINDRNNKESQITIFPNPAKNEITIETLQKSTIEILNIQGQIIIQQSVRQGKSEIDISSLAKGLYIMRLNSNDKTAVTKFVKE